MNTWAIEYYSKLRTDGTEEVVYAQYLTIGDKSISDNDITLMLLDYAKTTKQLSWRSLNTNKVASTHKITSIRILKGDEEMKDMKEIKEYKRRIRK